MPSTQQRSSLPAAVIGLVSLALATAVHAGERPWSFVQSVGGMSIGTPAPVAATSSFSRTQHWQLPVHADVSGRTNVTHPSKALHSALVCLKTKAEVRDQTIVLQVDTGVFRSGKSALCPPAELGPIAPGDYTVVYGDEAQPLGRVSIAP